MARRRRDRLPWLEFSARPNAHDDPTLEAVLLGSQVLGEGPAIAFKQAPRLQTVGSSVERAVGTARQPAWWGRCSMAAIKASRTASAHASLRSKRSTLTRGHSFNPDDGPRTNTLRPLVGAYSRNVHPRCIGKKRFVNRFVLLDAATWPTPQATASV